MVGTKEIMSKVKLVWATPNGEDLVAYMARVSNPGNQDNKESAPKLLQYLARNKHWSPFEMVNACVEIETTRDIARQILRHRSFSFQEFSQRYAEVNMFDTREARLQDVKNRQNSIPVQDRELEDIWQNKQKRLIREASEAYQWALSNGIAKEQARAVLPEGNTMSRMYMNGNLRSWLHYLQVRLDPSTQKEHRVVAEQVKNALLPQFPNILKVIE
jgi:thymidylate synthase (FAD)